MSGIVEIIGGTTVDIYVSVPRFPPGTGAEFGRATLAHCDRAASLSVGGNGGLAAYILGRLGQPARLHTRLGRDFWGGWLRARLEAAGVELASDSTDEESSTNIVATDGGGNRLSFFHPLEAQYAVAAPLPDTRVMFLGGCPHPTAELIASYVRPYRNAGATTVIDIGPAIPRPFRFDDLARLADALDLVTCNRAELRQLSGTSSLRRGVQVIHNLGIPTLVIKDGANGRCSRHPTITICTSLPSRRRRQQQARSARVIVSTRASCTRWPMPKVSLSQWHSLTRSRELCYVHLIDSMWTWPLPAFTRLRSPVKFD